MVLFRFFFESFRLTRPIEALPGPVIRGVEFLCFIKEFQLLFQTFDGPFFFFKGFAARTDRFVGGKEDLLLFFALQGLLSLFLRTALALRLFSFSFNRRLFSLSTWTSSSRDAVWACSSR